MGWLAALRRVRSERTKRKKGGEALVYKCGNCGERVLRRLKSCPWCGERQPLPSD